MATRPTFDIAEELELLEWDFTPKGEPRKSGPHGIIREPSTKQLDAFASTLRRVMAPVAGELAKGDALGDPTPEDIARALASADEDEAQAREMMHAMVQAVSDVCSGSPSVEEIENLPARGQQAFFGWVMGTFLDPNQQTPASK